MNVRSPSGFGYRVFTTWMNAPKRLIEVDLPIRRISAHARREKSIRHGHISTLHIWWARRPLAACRAVLCATLWPDPVDVTDEDVRMAQRRGESLQPNTCPPSFRTAAIAVLTRFAKKVDGSLSLHGSCSEESRSRWEVLAREKLILDPSDQSHQLTLRGLLLDFIADFANWDNSTVPEYLETARTLTQAAHEALGGEPGTRPLVADPFAGGGSIPLEALRVGADAFASDLNPVPVLLNKVVLEYIPKYGERLADEVRRWGRWVKEQAEKELAKFYPKDPDGATPVAYLWARTVRCEGPAQVGCGAEVPLLRSLWLAKGGKKSVGLKLTHCARTKRIDFDILPDAKAKDIGTGTVKRGSVTCPCGVTTPVEKVRAQLKARRGGATDARLFCVVTTRPGEQGRSYRLPTDRDRAAVTAAAAELEQRKRGHHGLFSLVPDEPLDVRGIRHTWGMIYGMERWGDFFTPRQLLALTTLCRLVRQAGEELAVQHPNGLAEAVQTCLSYSISKCADYWNSITTWMDRGTVGHAFTRQAVPIVWDYPEANPIATFHCSWGESYEWAAGVCEAEARIGPLTGTVECCSATAQPLPDEAVQALVTDPPYYDAVPYAYLSDFFYVWLRRSVGNVHAGLLVATQVPKDEEIVVDRPHELSGSTKDIAFYERELTRAFAEGRRIIRRDGIGLIVFASKTTSSWEAILKAVVDSGWTITGSWPVDTEREARISAQGQARLASSVHLVCRPRTGNPVGDWRDVLAELPRRIHEWMPRLSQEGVVGADAIFACLGPALEVFSRYGHVEKASGEVVTLREYLEHVWAAVAKEALAMILRGADATGFEEDARLTVLWFWVLKSAKEERGQAHGESDEEGADDEADAEEGSAAGGKSGKANGWQLEYDAVRKLAQGLGADLGRLSRPGGIITIDGKVAVLRFVQARGPSLVGGGRPAPEKPEKRKKTTPSLFANLPDDEPEGKARSRRSSAPKDPTVTMRPVESRRDALTDKGEPLGGLFAGISDTRTLLQRLVESGLTTLDRLHQAMLLFGRSHTALLGPFLTETGMGGEPRFWRLAQALSALYPPGTEEKRWVDGVLGRKKGLGF